MLVIVGFMGAGKTTVGRMLAARLDLPFLDSDHVIEARAGRPIPEIFQADGEPAFRALEHEVIADLLAGPAAVLALGGGAAAHEKTRKLLAAVPVVFLRISFAEALARVGGDVYRPMLARPDIADVYESRQAIYTEVATVIVDVAGRSPAKIANDVLGRLDEGRLAGPARACSRPRPDSRVPGRGRCLVRLCCLAAAYAAAGSDGRGSSGGPLPGGPLPGGPWLHVLQVVA